MPLISGDRRVLLPVYLSTVGTWAAYAIIIVVLPFRFEALGLSVEEYGIALGVYALGTLVTEGLWGYLAFKIGSARALGALGAVTAASMVALGFAHSFLLFTILLGLYGMIVVYSTPLVRWMAMSAAGPGTGGSGLGRLGLFFGIGLSAGTAIGPVIYTLWGFWMNIWVGTAVFVFFTVLICLVPWKTVRLPRRPARGTSSLRALLERRFVLATSLVVLYFMTYTVVTNFLQYYSIGLFHGTVDQTGYVIGAARGVALLTGLLVGATADRWGQGRAAPIGFLLLLTGGLGLWISSTYAEMTVFSLVLSAGAGWLGVSLLPMALSRILPEDQGTAVGVFGSFEDLGLILGPLLLGFVYTALGPRDLFPVAAALALAALAVSFATRFAGPVRTSSTHPG